MFPRIHAEISQRISANNIKYNISQRLSEICYVLILRDSLSVICTQYCVCYAIKICRYSMWNIGIYSKAILKYSETTLRCVGMLCCYVIEKSRRRLTCRLRSLESQRIAKDLKGSQWHQVGSSGTHAQIAFFNLLF